MLRSAEEILNGLEIKTMPHIEFPIYSKETMVDAINEARIECINECANIAKTYKVGNSGSWYDAAVDKTPIINLLNQLK